MNAESLKNGTAQAGSRCCAGFGRMRRGWRFDHQQHSFGLRIADSSKFGRCAVMRFGGSDQVAGCARSEIGGALGVIQPRAGRSSVLCFPIKNEHRYRSGMDGSRRFSRRTFRCFRHTSHTGSLSGRLDLRANSSGDGRGGALGTGPIDLPTPVSYNEVPTPSELADACRSVEFASQARNQLQLVAGLCYQAMSFKIVIVWPISGGKSAPLFWCDSLGLRMQGQ